MILCVCPNPSIDTISWINQILPGEVNRMEKQMEFPGGKGIHVALALEEIDVQCAVMGFWAGSAGHWIKERCIDRKITCYGPEVKGTNRKCYTFRSELSAEWDNTELLEPGPEIEEKDYRLFLEEFKVISQNLDIVSFSGSWPHQCPEVAYKELILIAKNNKNRVILDASGIQLKNALESFPFGLHLNLGEAKALLNTNDIGEILKYLSGYVELIALTNGKEGLYLKYKDKVIHGHITLENVFSTVGSGDCLTAGICYGLRHQMNLEDIARWGVACGAANCIREDLGMLYKKDVDDLLSKIEINELAL